MSQNFFCSNDGCLLLCVTNKQVIIMGNFDRKSLLLLTGGCAVAAFGVWLGSIAGGFWALALVGLSVCGVVALGLRGLLRRLSGQTLMVDGILLVGILACLSLEQSALVVNMVFAALAVFLCADVAAWFRQWRGSQSDVAVADAGRGVVRGSACAWCGPAGWCWRRGLCLGRRAVEVAFGRGSVVALRLPAGGCGAPAFGWVRPQARTPRGP